MNGLRADYRIASREDLHKKTGLSPTLYRPGKASGDTLQIFPTKWEGSITVHSSFGVIVSEFAVRFCHGI